MDAGCGLKMTTNLTSRYGSSKDDANRFSAEAGIYFSRNYCYIRGNEFVLQRMLMPEIFSRQFENALEIGCGVGFKAFLLRDLAHKVVGIDIDRPYHGFPGNRPAAEHGQDVLVRLRCNNVHLEAVPDFIDYLKKHRSSFDLVVSDYVMEHIADVDALHSAIFQSLRPGGAVIHTLPNTHDALEQFVRLNAQSSWKQLAKSILGCFSPRKRTQKMAINGTLVPITHSEFLGDFGQQFDIYRLERNAYAMIDCGYEISRIVPTREHSYTIAALRPRE